VNYGNYGDYVPATPVFAFQASPTTAGEEEGNEPREQETTIHQIAVLQDRSKQQFPMKITVQGARLQPHPSEPKAPHNSHDSHNSLSDYISAQSDLQNTAYDSSKTRVDMESIPTEASIAKQMFLESFNLCL
jgi:hypothetical protein